jgi:predicted small secreted protein
VPRPFLLLLLPLILAGCNVVRGPKVAVQGVSVTEATGEALGVKVLLEMRNPNRAPVELYDFHYSLHVDGRQVYEGRRAASATLGTLGTRSVELPAVVPFERLAWSRDGLPPAATYEVHGTLRYIAPNMLLQVLLDAGKRRPGVGFSSRGELAIAPASGS